MKVFNKGLLRFGQSSGVTSFRNQNAKEDGYARQFSSTFVNAMVLMDAEYKKNGHI